MLTPDLMNKVSIWRQKCLDDSISVEEMKEAILLLRENRRAAADTAASKRTASKGPAKSAGDLLAELNGL